MKNLFFLDSPGGCGKTFVFNAILKLSRSRGLIALPVASCGIAGILLNGGTTAHSRFKIPIALDEDGYCNIAGQSMLANLLREASVFIWDEAPMAHRHNIEAVDRSLRNLYDEHSTEAWRKECPFAGKVMIFGGDFRQILPVVPHANRAGMVAACLQRSALWMGKKIEVVTLTENMRVEKMMREDPERAQLYSDWAAELIRVGDGVGSQYYKVPSNMLARQENTEGLLQDVFGDLATDALACAPANLIDKAILSPRNEDVNAINGEAMAKFGKDLPNPPTEHVYNSVDTHVEQDDQQVIMPSEF